MGLAWSFLNPLLMLCVYTFVFSVVFKARWGTNGEESRAQFALILFVGMIVFGVFSDVIGRASTLVVANVNYVKKVVFPLEILPVVALGAALFHGVVSLAVLAAFYAATNGYLHWTSLYLPIVLAPLLLLILGIAWLLASLGVFLRDAGQTVGILLTMAMFLSPIFYPVTTLPEAFRPLLMANPLTFMIEQARAVLIWGQPPDAAGLAIYTCVAVCVLWAGYAWFQRTRRAFADVL